MVLTGDRFTSSAFPYTVDMSEEGKPDPTYALKAKLTGATFDFGVKSSTITGVADVSIPGGWNAATVPAQEWQSVTYGNGKFVAVSKSGNDLIYSLDGFNWTTTSVTYSSNWFSVTYGNGYFVAVGLSGSTSQQVMYSSDGISWLNATSTEANPWRSVAVHSNNRFVAVSSSGSNPVMYSDNNGQNWTNGGVSGEGKRSWQSIAFGGDKFVVVGQSGAIMYSTNGVNYTDISSGGTSWQSVAYGNGKFVAVSTGGDITMNSTDGINWTQVNTTYVGDWNSITYGDNKFVAVAPSATGSLVIWSPDGVNWNESSTALNSTWVSVVYGSDKFVATARSGAESMWSLTGTDEVKATALTCASNSNLDKLNTEGGAVFMTDGDIASDGSFAIASYQPTSSVITGVTETVIPAVEYNSKLTGGGLSANDIEQIFTIPGGVQKDIANNTQAIFTNDTGRTVRLHAQISSNGSAEVTLNPGTGSETIIANISGNGGNFVGFIYDCPNGNSIGFKATNATAGRVVLTYFSFTDTDEQLLNTPGSSSTALTFADPCTDLQYFNVGDTVTANEGNALYSALSPAMSTTLYTGDGSNRSINTGIDNTGKTLLWFKPTNVTSDHQLQSIEQGAGNWLSSNKTNQNTSSSAIQAYTETGVNVNGSSYVNGSGNAYVAWNFRAAPGFMDTVYVENDGSSTSTNIPHSLGVEPAFIIAKGTDSSGDWWCYHKDLLDANNNFISLNKDEPANGNSGANIWNPTTTTFDINFSSRKYNQIAYLFADTPGTIKCGSYIGGQSTGSAATQEHNCGFKPGWVMIKASSNTGNWFIFDRKRDNYMLRANLNSAENGPEDFTWTDTGFTTSGTGTLNWYDSIYVAIAEDATAGEFVPTGVVAEEPNTTNRTLKLNNITGNWADSTGFNTTIPASGAGGTWDSYTGSVATVSGTTGRWIGANAGSKAFSIAPVDGITEQAAEVYCAMQIIDDKAEVMGIQSTDPGFINVTAKDYTIEFPALFTSGEAPDTALPLGTAITATVKAENTLGASVRESNTFIPQLSCT